jgi:hemolysin D
MSAAFGLLGKYAAAFRDAWRGRKSMAPASLEAHELEFLPAHLELRDSPLSPAPLWVARLIVAFALLALAWSVWGEVDIVVVASGKVVPGSRTKVIQPLEPGVIKRIAVRDGDRVRNGDLLVELDATSVGADVSKSQNELASAQLGAARAQALLEAQAQAHPEVRMPPSLPGASQQQRAEQLSLAQAQLSEYRARGSALQAELAQRQAELASAREVLSRSEQTMPLVRERAANYKALLDQQLVARHAYMEREQDRVEREGELATHRARLGEAEAAVQRQMRQIDSLATEFRRTALELLATSRQQISLSGSETVKSRQRDALTRLTAPIDGVVQQLVVHTAGGVVQTAQVLMVIVPLEDHVEIEAWVENKDVGFVKQGQRAAVKVDAFPYTRFGLLEGKVGLVSSDAVQDEKRGPIFQARITVPARELVLNDASKVALSPGMAVTADIATGRRSLISYFLSPLQALTSESLRER